MKRIIEISKQIVDFSFSEAEKLRRAGALDGNTIARMRVDKEKLESLCITLISQYIEELKGPDTPALEPVVDPAFEKEMRDKKDRLAFLEARGALRRNKNEKVEYKKLVEFFKVLENNQP